MRKKENRILSVLISILLIFSLIPVNVPAGEITQPVTEEAVAADELVGNAVSSVTEESDAVLSDHKSELSDVISDETVTESPDIKSDDVESEEPEESALTETGDD